MWLQGEAGAIAAIATELSKNPGLRIGIGSRAFPAEKLRDFSRATSVATLPISEDLGNPEALIGSKELQRRLSGLDMIVESPDGILGVELKLARAPGKLAPSVVERDLESYETALRDASESLGKRYSGLIFVTNLDLAPFFRQRLEGRDIRLVSLRPSFDSLARAARIIETELATGHPKKMESWARGVEALPSRRNAAVRVRSYRRRVRKK